MKTYRKQDFPLDQVRRHLEPGPIVLVTSSWRGERNVMTLGWHMMLGFEPAELACYVWDENHSFEMLRRSKQCVINVPTVELVEQVVAIGNCTGTELDKLDSFGLTTTPATKVSAPLIAECYASFECRLVDSSWVKKRGVFVWECVKAHVARSPKHPRTLHYRGDGEFMVAGDTKSLRRKFKPQNL